LDDPYKILGVARSASADDVRRAYRKLAKTHHPDLNPGNAKAEDVFKAVSAANDLLSDPGKRARFDRGEIDAAGQPSAPQGSYHDHADGEAGQRYSRENEHFGGWSDEGFADMFGSVFRGARNRGAEARARGGDEHYSLETDFLSAVNGATRRLTLPDGRALNAKIPPGTLDGQVLRLRGQGGEGWNGGPAGDALIEIHVTPHAFFSRVGQNIRLDLPITVAEAVLGGFVETPTPGGPVRVRVPPHSDTGSELRLRGRGVPKHGSQPAGDLLATLRVRLGPPDPALDAFMKSWTRETPFNPRSAMETLP
jgi:DnaJ-class molecular chaperone